jgi:hypothetical protein
VKEIGLRITNVAKIDVPAEHLGVRGAPHDRGTSHIREVRLGPHPGALPDGIVKKVDETDRVGGGTAANSTVGCKVTVDLESTINVALLV